MRGAEYKAEGESLIMAVYKALPQDADYRADTVAAINDLRALIGRTRYGQAGTTYAVYAAAVRTLVTRIVDSIPGKAPAATRKAADALAAYVTPEAAAARQAIRAGDASGFKPLA